MGVRVRLHTAIILFSSKKDMRWEKKILSKHLLLCVCLFYVRILHGGGRCTAVFVHDVVHKLQTEKFAHFFRFLWYKSSHVSMTGTSRRMGENMSSSLLVMPLHLPGLFWCSLYNMSYGHVSPSCKSTYSTWFNSLQQVFEENIRPSFGAVKNCQTLIFSCEMIWYFNIEEHIR